MNDYQEFHPNYIGKLQKWCAKHNFEDEHKVPIYNPPDGKNLNNASNVSCSAEFFFKQ